MKEDRVTDMVFIFYIVVVIALAFIYFNVPERGVMLSNAIDWWSQLLNMIEGDNM